MFYTPEEIPDYSPIFLMTQKTFRKTSAGKSLCLFTNIFDVKKRTDIRCVGDDKSKHISIKSGCSLWKNKNKRKGNSKINEQMKSKLYTWITRHHQIV